MITNLPQVKNKIATTIISLLIFFNSLAFSCEKHPDAKIIEKSDGSGYICEVCYQESLKQSNSVLDYKPQGKPIGDSAHVSDVFSNMATWKNDIVEIYPESSTEKAPSDHALRSFSQKTEVWEEWGDAVQYVGYSPEGISTGLQCTGVDENAISLIHDCLFSIGLHFNSSVKDVAYLETRMNLLEDYFDLLGRRYLYGDINVGGKSVRLQHLDVPVKGAGVGMLPEFDQIVERLSDEKCAILEIKIERTSCYFLMVVDLPEEAVYLLNRRKSVAVAMGKDLIEGLETLYFDVNVYNIEPVANTVFFRKNLLKSGELAKNSRMPVGQTDDDKADYQSVIDMFGRLSLSEESGKHHRLLKKIARGINGKRKTFELSKPCKFEAIPLNSLLSQAFSVEPPLVNPEVGIIRFALECPYFCRFEMNGDTYMKQCEKNNKQNFIGYVTTLMGDTLEGRKEGVLCDFVEEVKINKKKSWLLKAHGMTPDEVMLEVFIVRIRDGKWNIIQPFTGYWTIPDDKRHLTDVYKVLTILFEDNSPIEFYDVTHMSNPHTKGLEAQGSSYDSLPELVSDSD